MAEEDLWISGAVQMALNEGYLSDTSTRAMFYDLDKHSALLDQALDAFPPTTLHTLAIKANPVASVLKVAVEKGWGLECASWTEVEMAKLVGCSPANIVYDSPVKTRSELRQALELGVYLNADNMDELARIEEILRSNDICLPTSTIGLRLNPQLGPAEQDTSQKLDRNTGAPQSSEQTTITRIDSSFTVGQISKFGVPLQECRDAVISAFHRFEWLTGLHVHVGSQGTSLDDFVAALGPVVALIEEINADKQHVRCLDIGGGLSVNYDSAESGVSFAMLAERLLAEIPVLKDYQLVTEFGRSLHAKCGFTASQVEYTKTCGGRHIILQHVGADLFLRTAYLPDVWKHRLSLLDAAGTLMTGERKNDKTVYDVAGPLCFSGDKIAIGVTLPRATSGDWLVVHDTGAYTLGMWSRYCSRQSPPVLGLSAQKGVHLLRPEETVEDVLRFWSGDAVCST